MHNCFQSFAATHDLLQVGALRWVCLQHLVAGINANTVLKYATLADAVSDDCLMEECIAYLTKEYHG